MKVEKEFKVWMAARETIRCCYERGEEPARWMIEAEQAAREAYEMAKAK
jgi:hypothetical protein